MRVGRSVVTARHIGVHLTKFSRFGSCVDPGGQYPGCRSAFSSLHFASKDVIPAGVAGMSCDYCSLQLTLLSLSLNERDYISCFALSVLAS